MVRGALSALLSLEADIEVVGSAPDGEAAWRELQRLKPDVLVTDIEMPGLTGLELAQRVQRQQLPVRVVILTTFARPGFLRRALDAGVCGYLLKDSPAEQLADRSEEHTSELQSLMRISYAVFCLKKKTKHTQPHSCNEIQHSTTQYQH